MTKKDHFLIFAFLAIISYLPTIIFGEYDSSSINKQIRQAIQQCTIKVLAFYFPQFHEVAENNQFWGKGFTEWTLMDNYKGEIKRPHPDVGYYNMLNYDVRAKQAKIAKEHGISGFCYYHYWFKNKKVMHLGIEKILEDGEPNIPFAFCWANETWAKNWEGKEAELLLKQDYGNKSDWIAHYNYLSQFFHHPNYIKEDGCPIFYIYRIAPFVNKKTQRMLKFWKKLAVQDNFKGLKIIAILNGLQLDLTQDLLDSLDGLAEHQPNFGRGLYKEVLHKELINQHTSFDIKQFYSLNGNNKKLNPNYSRGIFYSWDNRARRINSPSINFANSSYELFEQFIIKTIENIAQDPNIGTNWILLNSWNEWTEQAMVEPNNIDGYNILNVIKNIFGPQI